MDFHFTQKLDCVLSWFLGLSSHSRLYPELCCLLDDPLEAFALSVSEGCSVPFLALKSLLDEALHHRLT